MTAYFRFLLGLMAVSVIACLDGATGPAQAQLLDASTTILPEIEVRGRGWIQLSNPAELLEFALALVETTLMVGTIAYHPVKMAIRRAASDFDAPRDLFVYALIGMVVGFLIMHHGYLIGFVLFGLGGLLRFKSDDGSADTMRLILATLIGLCVGLDLPVVAMITTISAWIVIYAFGGLANFAVEVRFTKEQTVSEAMLTFRQQLSDRGFKTVSMSKAKFKPIVSYVVTCPRGVPRSALEREISKLVENRESGISDWHVD